MGVLYDKQLLKRLKCGDKESFNELFETHYSRYLSFARGLLRDPDAAEDVVQNVFMKLWIARARIDEERSVHNFLLVAIRNEIFNHMRQRYNAKRWDIELPDVEDKYADIDLKYSFTETEAHMHRIIERMPPQRKVVFNLSRTEHLSNAEIAQLLHISQRTVEKHIEQALRQLRTTINFSVAVLIVHLF